MANVNAFATSASTTLLTSSSSLVTVDWPSNAHTSAATATKNGNSRQNALNHHRRLSRKTPPIYHIKLAEKCETSNFDSDHSSFYDSANEMETDAAKSESDLTDGSDKGVTEYEVDELSDSEDIESHDTSSGTDDIHSRLFNGSSTADTQSDSNDLELCAQDADMEESDGPIEQEFRRADFSICFKCKSQKTNPQYQYCKKCYQIRRTHFPPRPKRRRKRASLAQRGDSQHSALNSPSTTQAASMQNAKRDRKFATADNEEGGMSRNSSCDGTVHMVGQMEQPQPHQQQSSSSLSSLQKHHSHEHSAGESSCYSSQETLSLDDQLSFSMATATSITSQSTFGSGDIDRIFSRINSSSTGPHSHSLERNYPPSSQASVYPNAAMASRDSSFILETDSGIISKMDSTASTVSAFTVSGLSQSSEESNSQGKLVMATTSTVTATASPSASALDTATNAIPPAALIERASSHTVTSTQMMTKRKINSTNGSRDNGNDDVATPMTKRTKHSMNESDDEEAQAAESSLNGLCMICVSKPKNGAFVHSNLLHVCCCYRCAVKVWNKKKRCPICNVPVKTVLKIFVH